MNYSSTGYTDRNILDKLEKYAGLTGRSRSEVLDQALALFMEVLQEERLRTLPPPPREKRGKCGPEICLTFYNTVSVTTWWRF